LLLVEDEDPELSLRIWEELFEIMTRNPESTVSVGIDILFFKFIGTVSKTHHSIIVLSLRFNISFPDVTPNNYYER
tara:strand:- start:472 stop:699 length:228 start_codon:yes stop_codon:yes gene_type:complete